MHGDARHLLRVLVMAVGGVGITCFGIYYGLLKRRFPSRNGKVLERNDAALAGLATVLLGASLLYAALTLDP